MVAIEVGIRKYYEYTCEKNSDAVEYVKWLRRNLGSRGEGWDFSFIGGRVIIDI